MIARFGAFELDSEARELRKSGIRVRVPPQSVEILTALLQHPGDVVTRDEIRERLWPNGTIVEFEHSVNAAIKRLRDALCDSADTPRFIETLPRAGYRFLVQVEKREPGGDGHFRILGEAGRGAMGVVYRAEDLQLGRTVALKFLPEELAEQPSALDRLRREARIVASLNHPGICTLYGIDRQGDRLCLVMEHLEGQPLSRMLENGRLEEAQAIRVGIQVADAVEAAHSKGVIHGDIKPSNIFVTSSGQVKLMDFGIASRTGDGASAVRGTPGYMSPEQAEGKPVDRRSDVFGMGCVLYEMITRRQAFPPNAVAGAAEGMPGPLGQVVSRCLQKDPDARFQSMVDLKRALEELREAPGQQALADSAARRPAQPPRFYRTALMIVFAGLLITTFGWWWSMRRRTDGPPVVAAPVPVTTYQGVEEYPTLSPDGDQVAFSGNIDDPNNFDIYVKVIGAEPPLRLTQDPQADSFPAWSPDGRWIAFVRGRRQLLLVSPLGGAERMIAEDLLAELGYEPLVLWSPDSRNVITEIAPAPGQQSGTFAVSIVTGERRRLNWPAGAGRGVATFSKDGRVLAYAQFEARSGGHPARFSPPQLYVAAVSSNLELLRPRRIEWGKRWRLGGCAWTPGARGLICSLLLPDTRQGLWRIDTEGNAAPQVLPLTEDSWNPRIAGSRLVFERFKFDTDIWRVPNPAYQTADAAPVRLISSTRPDRQAQYSPDGKSIAFASSRSGPFEVWVAAADGSAPRMLTSLSGLGRDLAPRWSPDGNSIVFGSNQSIYVVAAAGGVAQRLVSDPPLKASWPSYSHDGLWIYFCVEGQVWRMPRAGGAASQITRHGGSQPLESPDGRHLFFVKEEGGGQGLWRIPSQGGPESRVMEQLSVTQFGGGKFASAKDGLFCIRYVNPDHKTAIDVVDPATGAVRQVRTLHVPQRFNDDGLSVSPDGRWFLYTAFEIPESDLMQIENFH